MENEAVKTSKIEEMQNQQELANVETQCIDLPRQTNYPLDTRSCCS
jgi:hypothetical protein